MRVQPLSRLALLTVASLAGLCPAFVTVATAADTTPPVITCPAPVTVQCDADVPPPNILSVTVTDDMDPNPTVVHMGDSPSGSCPKTITRTYQATDASANSSMCTQIITVNDTTPPTINCSPNQTVECGLFWNFTAPSASDNCGSAMVTIVSTATNNTCGNTYVANRVWQAADACGNTALCTQTVSVVDTTIPAVSCPSPITAKTTDLAGAIVTFSATTADICDPSPVLTCVPPSGNTFPVGNTTVTCTSVDSCNNSNSCSFLVTVLFRSTTNYVVGATIPDNNINGLASTKTFASPIGIVTDVNVTLKTTAGYNGDLYVYLVHDSGFSVLLNRVGRTASDSFGYGDAGFNVTFDDQAADDVHLYRLALFGNNTMPLGGALTNSWKPDGRASDPLTVLDTDSRTELLSSFNGLNPNGSWTLFAADLSPVSAATLDNWGLDICGSLPVPASITSQPGNTNVQCSSNLTLTVVTAGTGPLTNQWFHNDIAIPNATNASLMLTNLHPSDSGTNLFVVCNMAGCVTSAPISLVVTDTIAPTITTCASPQTLCTATNQATVPDFTGQVVASDACSSVVVTQFPLAGSLVNTGLTTVTLTAKDASNNTNACTVVLTVHGLPIISVQPQNQTTPMGNGAVFSVTAGGTTPLTYQWFSNGVSLAGATATNVAVSNLLLSASGSLFSVVVSDCAGSITSQVAVLTVSPISGISFDFNTPGQFTNAPYNLVGNDWVNSALINNQPFGPITPFEVSTGGVGVATGGGGLDLMFNRGDDNTSILLPVSFDFSLPGKTLTASIMVKIKVPTAAQRAIQIGFLSATQSTATAVAGLTGTANESWISAIFQSTVVNIINPGYHLRGQVKPFGGTAAFEYIPVNAPTNALDTNRWYKLVATFKNVRDVTADSFTLDASVQDMGRDGLTPGANTLLLPTLTMTNRDFVFTNKCYLAIRCFENGGNDYWDNIFVSTTTGPAFFVAQPASQTVPQGRTASFQALVDGNGPYAYQWNKNGTPIPGATQWKYTTPLLSPGDNLSGYTVTVTTTNNTITSSAAVVTVTADPLAVLSVGSVDGGIIGLRFNQPVNQASAESAGNYMVNGVAAVAAQLRVNNGVQQYKTNGTEILITPASPVSGSFTVAVSGVTAVSGAVLGGNNSAVGQVAGLTGYDVDPLSFGLNGQVGTLPGFNYSFAPGSFEITAGGHDIAGAFDGFRFLYKTITGDFDLKVRVPYLDVLRANTKAGFDARVSLDPTAPMVGAFLNPVLPAANRYEGNVRQVYNAGSAGWGNSTAATFPNAWLRFRRVGNTFLRYSSINGVTWLLDGQTSPVPAFPPTIYVGLAANCNVTAGQIQQHATSQYDSYGDFAGYGPAVITISQQPTNPPSITAGAAAALPLQTAVIVTYTTNGVLSTIANEVAYLWQRTNTAAGGWTNMPTAGQTANVLTPANIGTLWASDNGAQFRCIISAPGAVSVTSSPATITVTDTALPTVSSPAAFSSNSLPMLSTHQIVLNFSEFMDSATALNPANYTVTNSAGVNMGVASVQFLRGDARTVVITTIAPLAGETYFVVINNVRDLNANAIAANTVRAITLRGGAASAVNGEAQVVGPIVVEWTPYLSVARAGMGDFVNSSNFAAWVSYSNVFGIWPNNANFPDSFNNYGARMFTYFVPPTNSLASWTNTAGVLTNGYKFYLRADDFAEFIMNTNADPAKSILPMDVLVGTSTNSPGAQNAAQAMDGVSSNYANAKYLNFDAASGSTLISGFYVTPAVGNTVVGGIRFWAGGDAFQRDPWSFSLAGSVNPGTNGPWIPIGTGLTLLVTNGGASGLGRYMPSTSDIFFTSTGTLGGTPTNTTAYRSYRVLFPAIRGTNALAPGDSLGQDAMQIGEVQFLGTNGAMVVPSGATMLMQLTGNIQAYAGATSSSNLALNAGQKYYMEVRFKETGGGDGVTVAVANDNGVAVPGQSAVIPGAFCSFPTPLADPTPVQWELYNVLATFAQQGYVQSSNQLNGNIWDLLYVTNSQRFIARIPNLIGYCKGFGWNTNQANLGSTFDGYLGRLTAYFVAPSNGLYRFWMASDDSSQLWMNTNAVNTTDPAGMQLLGQVIGANNLHALVAQNVALVGGQRYYLEGRWREGGSADGLRVAVRAQSDGAQPGLGEFIPGSLLEMATNEVRYGQIKLAGITASVDGSAPVTTSALNVLPGSVITFNAVGIQGAGTALGIGGVGNAIGSLGLVWLKNGSGLLANQVQESLEFYVTPPVTPADNGSVITLLVSNSFSVATSQSVTLNVLPATAPTLVRAVGSLSDDSVVVTFNQRVDSFTALQLGNYRIAGLTVLSVSRDDRLGRSVILRTSRQAIGTTYTLMVSGVRDASGTQTITPGSTITFGTWVGGGAGFYVEIYTNIPGSITENLTSDPKFIYNMPDVTYYTNLFGVGQYATDSGLNNFGARVSGWFLAPSNGFYCFYIRGDDGTKIFMNTNGPDPGGKVLIARNDGNNSGGFTNGLGLGRVGLSISPILSLTNNTSYYIEGLFKEGGGGEHMEVFLAAINPATLDPLNPIGGMPVPGLGVIAGGGYFNAPGNPDLAAAIGATLPPDYFASENEFITMIPSFTTPAVLRLVGASGQWQRFDGVSTFTNIPGARGPFYTFAPTVADNGVQYQLTGLLPGVPPLTTTLHVTPAVPPAVIAIQCDLDNFTNITIVYNKQVTGDAADNFLYIYDGNQFVGFGTMSADNRSVTFQVPPYLPGSLHLLEVSGVPDLAGNMLTTNVPWQACPITPGVIKYSVYDTASVPGGLSGQNLRDHPNYINNILRQEGYLSALNSRLFYPDDTHEQYGGRMEGLFIPTVTTNYIFEIRNDDGAELWINPTGPGKGGVVLAINTGTTCCQGWDSQQSSTLFPGGFPMVAGQAYFIRSLYKEAGGGDFGAVTVRHSGAPVITGTDVNLAIQCDRLGVVENPILGASIILRGPPADIALPALAQATFQVTNTGVASSIFSGTIAPAVYRWQISRDNGVTWQDAGGCGVQASAFAFIVSASDNGALVRAVALVPGVRAYSAPALITITPNPIITGVTTRGNCHQVTAIFSLPMNLDGTYTLSGGVTATLLGYGRNTSEVVLSVTPPLIPDLVYTLTVANATSIGGFGIYPAPATKTFTHGAEYPPFALTYKRYSNTGSGVNLTDLYASPNFPNNPDIVTYNQAFFEVPTDTADSYGATISGYYIAPTTGNFRFWMSSDDGGATFLSTDANPNNKVQINREPVWNGSRAFADLAGGRRTADVNGFPSETQSPPIPLTAGQVVYLEGQMKEGGGGDNYSCAVTINALAPPANGSLPIPASAFKQFRRSPNGCQFTTLCDVFLNPPPVSQTRVEGQTATFSGMADGTPGETNCYTYQWYRNGLPIAGATLPSYTTGVLDCNDNGAIFSLVAWNDFSSVSNSAMLSVTANTTPPVVLSASTDNASYQRVSVRFSRPLGQATAEATGNYSILNLGDSSPLAVIAAALQPDLMTVVLTTPTQARNASYRLTVQDVADRSCVPIVLSPNPSMVVFNTANVCLGLVKRDWFMNMAQVPNTLNTLYIDPRWPNNPTSNDFLQAFNSTQTPYDYYAVRLTGYIIAPETANYQFQIHADDSGYLAVGSDVDPNTPVQLIAVNGDCGACSSPQSAVVHLTAGQAYAVDARFQEGTGGDYLEVYWRNNLSIPTYTILSGLNVGITAPLATLNVTGPSNLSVEEHSEVIFTVTATASTSPILYQWKKNGVVIPGATGPTISFPVVLLGDAGTYSCYVSCPGACTEPTVTLTVTPDVSPPFIVSAGSLDGIHVGLCYNEPVDPATGGDSFNYSVNGGAIGISTLELSPDGRRVVITLATPISGAFTVNATNITDQAVPAHTGSSSATSRVMGLTAMDIGIPGDPIFMGTNFVCTSNTIEVMAGGHDIWDNQDGFNFIYTQMTGDFDMSVRVSRLDFTSTWAKAGLMAREDLTPGSRNHNAIVDPTAGANIYEANKRSAADGASDAWSTFNPAPVRYPNAWIRLSRVGDLFSAYASSNAVDWVLYGTNTPSPGYPRTLYVGMGTTAHNNAAGVSTFALYNDFTIRDIEPPQFICTNVVADCDSPAGAHLNYVVPVTDNTDMNPVVICVPSLTGLFPLGDTMVNCTATDASSNTSTCSFTLSVVDRIPPVISVCGPNHTYDLGLSCTFPMPDLRGQIVASDACGMVTAQSPAPGTVLGIGSYIVTFTVSDPGSNSTTCSITIAVLEHITPAIVCPPDLVVECGNPTTPPATGVATATDNCDTNITITSFDHGTTEIRPGSLGGWTLSAVGDPPTASATFVNGPSPAPLGTGTLRLFLGNNGDAVAQARTTNFHGIRLSALTELSFRTYVTASSGNGETPFLLLTIDSDGNGSADDVIGFEPEYQSGYTLAVPNQGPVANGVWQKWDAMVGGWYSINHSGVMTDGSGVRSLATYIAAFPNARIVNASSGAGGLRLVAESSFGTWDDFDGNVDRFTIGVNGASIAYDFDLTPGDPNPIIVRTWTATDDSTNVISCSQVINVVDTTPPTVTCPSSVLAKTMNPAGDNVSFVVSRSDACDPNPILVCVPASGSFFPMGSTTVHCTVTDATGNSNTCSFVLTVNLIDAASFAVNSPIPDNNANGYASTKTVATQIGRLTDVNVRLNLSGGYNGDLYAYLVHGSGYSVLLNRVGRRVGDPLGYADTGFNLTVDDQAANGDVHVYRQTLFGNPNTPLAGPLTNSWAPDGRATDPAVVLDTDARTELLSSFNGLNPNGEWTLFVADVGPLDTATLVSWSLDLCGLPAIPPSITVPPQNQTVQCSSNATFTVVSAGTPPLTNQWYRNGTALPGENGAILVRTGTSLANGNLYHVVVRGMGGSATSAPATLTVVDTIAPVVICPANIVAECLTPEGSVVSFSPTVVEGCSIGLAASCVPPSGSLFPPGLTTVNCSATDAAHNVGNSCSFTVQVVDTTSPTFCNATAVVSAAGGTNDNFAGPEAASPSQNLTNLLFSLTLRGFDDGGSDRWFAHTFTNLPADISDAVLRIRLRGEAGVPQNDVVEMLFSTPGGGLLPASWNRRIGTGGFDAVPGLLPTPWNAGSVTELVLNLGKLRNADNTYTDLLPTLHAQRYLDLIVQEDTAVDYAILEVKSCQCRSNITVNVNPATCGAVVTFATPVFSDTCDISVPVVCSPASGSTFPIGTTTVFCSGTDDSGNIGHCAFEVTVTEPPPVLRINPAGADVLLSWPITCAHYRLLQAASLAQPISWTPVMAPVSISGGEYHVLQPAGGPYHYYRLVTP